MCRARWGNSRSRASPPPPSRSPTARRGRRRAARPGGSSGPPSEGAQEVHEVLFLAVRKADAITTVVEVDELAQRRGRSIREIRRAGREASKLLHHDRADVVAESGDQGAPRVLRVDDATEERSEEHTSELQ